MTEVSWKRILQNAGAGLPNDEQMHPAPYGQMYEDRVSGDDRNVRRPQPARCPQAVDYGQPSRDLTGLEMDLQRALNCAPYAARPQPRPVTPQPRLATARRREPTYAPEPVERRRVQLPVPYAQPVPIRPAAPKRRKGGLRNLIAISLSAAVVGFAAHEVSVQWKRSHSVVTRQGKVAAIDPAVTSALSGKQAAMAFQSLQENEPMGVEDPLQAPKASAVAYVAPEAPRTDTRGATPATVRTRTNIRPVTRAEEEALMQRAMTHMENGDIGTARLFLQHLADRNSALAAIMLAKTYETKYIAAFNVKGLTANPEMARKWYKRAAELGNREAVAYLNSAR